MDDDSTTLAHNSSPARGRTDRFNTFEEFGDYFRRHLGTIVTGLVTFVAGMFYFRSRFDIDPSVFFGIVVCVPILSLLSWKFVHARYSRPGYVQVTDEEIVRNTNGHEESFRLSTLRNVELPSKKEMNYGGDYIYLYFGDGTCLELEKWIPNFPQIKRAIMERIAVHPDLDFLRRRLSKGAAA